MRASPEFIRLFVSIIVDDLPAAIAMMRTPDGHGRVELTKFRSPELVKAEPVIAPPNTLGRGATVQVGSFQIIS